MRKPDFFVVGAAKSGTTSLYYYLSQNPEIYLPPIKEPVYFAKDLVEKYYRCGKEVEVFNPKVYFSKKPYPSRHIVYFKDFKYYSMLFEDIDESKKAVGEMSAVYLASKVSAKNIFDFNPDAKIIVILRNPVERAFSQFLMRLRDGKISETNFLTEVLRDYNMSENECKVEYIERGLYFPQLKRFFDLFPKENIKIILFEDFISDTKNVLKDLFLFLNVSPISVNTDEVKNKGKLPKFPLFNRRLKSFRRKMFFLFPDKMPGWVVSLYDFLFMNSKKPVLSKSEREKLLEFFKEDIEKTQKLINRDLSDWLKV